MTDNITKKQQELQTEYETILNLTISPVVNGKAVTLQCRITNIGTGVFAPLNTYVFIDMGKLNGEGIVYEFPFLQEKSVGPNDMGYADCILSHSCKKGICNYPIQDLDFGVCCQMNHLSSKSVYYIASGETFYEDLSLQLEPGCYRAILVTVSNDDKSDCKCCSCNFFIT